MVRSAERTRAAATGEEGVAQRQQMRKSLCERGGESLRPLRASLASCVSRPLSLSCLPLSRSIAVDMTQAPAFTIRTELVSDQPMICSLHTDVFERAAEAAITAMLRARSQYDPTLSFVAACADATIIGHALFSPYTLWLRGEPLNALSLAPVGVHPQHQRCGVGSRLIERGIADARERGFDLCFVLGHPGYYDKRFAFESKAFGTSILRLSLQELARVAVDTVLPVLETRQPRSSDAVALAQLWLACESAVDFSLEPGARLTDWLSPNPSIECLVFVDRGTVVGYSRHARANTLQPRQMLVASVTVALAMAALLSQLHESRSSGDPSKTPAEVIELPLHPSSTVTAQLRELFRSAEISSTPHEACMALPLSPKGERCFREYRLLLQQGSIPCGRPIWPPVFDLGTH